jgi:hypothetical protein
MANWTRSLSVAVTLALVLGAAALVVAGASSLVGELRTSPAPSAQVPGLAAASSPLRASLMINPTTVDLGQSFPVQTSATGGDPNPAYTYTYYGMPAGCTTDEAQSWTCSPTAPGQFSIYVAVNDNDGNTTNSNTEDVTVNSILSVTVTVSPGSITEGQSVTVQTTANGGSGSYSYTYSGTPSGCGGYQTQMFTCQPNVTGTYHISVQVMDSLGTSNTSNSQALQITSTGSGSGGSGGGGSGGNNSSNPLAGLLSGFSGALSLLLIAGIIGFITWILLLVGVWIIAVVLVRRLPKRGAAAALGLSAPMVKCANCSAQIPTGTKFCPECGSSTGPKNA